MKHSRAYLKLCCYVAMYKQTFDVYFCSFQKQILYYKRLRLIYAPFKYLYSILLKLKNNYFQVLVKIFIIKSYLEVRNEEKD